MGEVIHYDNCARRDAVEVPEDRAAVPLRACHTVPCSGELDQTGTKALVCVVTELGSGEAALELAAESSREGDRRPHAKPASAAATAIQPAAPRRP